MAETTVPQKKAVDPSRREAIKNIGAIGLGLATLGITRNLFAYAGPETNGKTGKETASQTVTAISAQGRGRLEFNNYIVVVAPEPEETIRFYGPNLGRVEDIRFKDVLNTNASDKTPQNQRIFLRLPDFSLKSIPTDAELVQFNLKSFEKNALITGVKINNDTNTYFYILPPGASGVFVVTLPPNATPKDLETALGPFALKAPIEANPQFLVLGNGIFALVANKKAAADSSTGLKDADIVVFMGNGFYAIPIHEILNDYNSKQKQIYGDKAKPVTSFSSISISEVDGKIRVRLDTLPTPYAISPMTGDFAGVF